MVTPEDTAAAALAGELFEALGRIEARRMFGGMGLYVGGIMFGLIDDGCIYLKVDEALKSQLKAAGAESWIYVERKGSKAGVPQETSYWSLPESACDDPEEAAAWAARALAVATAVRAAAPPRRKRGGGAGPPRR